MGNVATFACFAQSVSLDRLGKDHCRASFGVDRVFERRVDFFRIVAATSHRFQFVVTIAADQLERFRVLSEKVVPNVRSWHNDVFLILTIDDFAHTFGQHARFVFLQKRIPVITPNHLDHVPARTAEDRFEFLDDFSITANRSIQTLQVAVDDERQVVQSFPSCQRDRTECFRFVTFAVAKERPYALVRGVFDSTIAKVFVKASLVDRHDRREAHRYGWVFPKIGH